MELKYARLAEENLAKSAQIQEIQQRAEQLKSDITIVQTELADAKYRYQKFSQIASVGIIVATMEGRVLECNESGARMFGYDGAADALSRTGKDAFKIFAFHGNLGASLRQEGKLENIEWSSLDRNGRLIRFRENATLLNAPNGGSPLVERILTDITRLHKLSEEMRLVRKMESTGDITAAAVKSVKNLCESLTQCGNLLKEAPDDISAVRQVAETLLKDAKRGIKYERQFLQFASKAERAPALINVNEVLANNESLLHSLVGEDIDLQIELSPEPNLISADYRDIVQLISNLVVSSRSALPLGGTVILETRNIELDVSASDLIEEMHAGTYVQMTISADGCTVQPERRTTFNRMIVDRLGAWITSANDPGTGNVHKLFFPRVEPFAGQTEISPDASDPESPVTRTVS